MCPPPLCVCKKGGNPTPPPPQSENRRDLPVDMILGVGGEGKPALHSSLFLSRVTLRLVKIRIDCLLQKQLFSWAGKNGFTIEPVKVVHVENGMGCVGGSRRGSRSCLFFGEHKGRKHPRHSWKHL